MAGWAGVAAAMSEGQAIMAEPPANHVAVDLVVPPVPPAGGEILVGVRFKIEKGWHIYWNGQNDSGMSPTLSWTLPPGYSLGEARWPSPVRHASPGNIVDHVYEREAVLLVPIRATPGATGAGPREAGEIAVQAEWLVCNDVCVPEEGSARAAIPAKASAAVEEALAKARTALAKAWPKDGSITASLTPSEGGFTLAIGAKGARGVAFFPKDGPLVPREGLAACAVKGKDLSIRLRANPQAPAGEPRRLRGLVEVKAGPPGEPRTCYELDLEFNDDKASSTTKVVAGEDRGRKAD